MKPVVRLKGDDSDVRAVAREAVAVLERQPNAGPDLFRSLWTLHERRRRIVAEQAMEPATTQVSPERGGATDAPGLTHRVVWWVLLSVGLAAGLTAAVMFGPAGHKEQGISADTAASVALVCFWIALPALLLALAIRVPDPDNARYGETITGLVALVVAATLVYRLAVGPSPDHDFTSDQLRWWGLASAAQLVVLLGIVWRCDPVRRRAATLPAARPANGPRADVTRELRRTAEQLAATDSDKEAMADWKARLATLERRGLPAETISQASSMTPAAWMAWLCYDGEIDVSSVMSRR